VSDVTHRPLGSIKITGRESDYSLKKGFGVNVFCSKFAFDFVAYK
jgi:hypothetical protein